MTVVLAILVFGFLIFIHEFGHFICARIFGVTVKEFSLGMGPKLFSKTSEKSHTAYSLRLLPIGGFVSMVGEDEESDDKGALCNKPVWQRMIIVCAGGFMNILVGILVVLVIVLSSAKIGSNTIAEFTEESTLDEQGLKVEDTIVAVNGKKTHIARDLSERIMFEGVYPCDVTVIRNGEKVVLENISFSTASEEGLTFGKVDFYVYAEPKSFGSIVKQTVFYSISSVDMIWKSLTMLVTGKVGIDQMSGPVGVTSAIDSTAKVGFSSVLDLIQMIALNLGIFNLLPLPALDGGRFAFMLYELIRGKPVNRDIEGYIHFAGLALLMVLMLVITCKDIIKLFVK